MEEFLNSKEKSLLEFLRIRYKKTLEVKFRISADDYEEIGVVDYEELDRLLAAMSVRKYICFDNTKKNDVFHLAEFTLSEKALNFFNSEKELDETDIECKSKILMGFTICHKCKDFINGLFQSLHENEKIEKYGKIFLSFSVVIVVALFILFFSKENYCGTYYKFTDGDSNAPKSITFEKKGKGYCVYWNGLQEFFTYEYIDDRTVSIDQEIMSSQEGTFVDLGSEMGFSLNWYGEDRIGYKRKEVE